MRIFRGTAKVLSVFLCVLIFSGCVHLLIRNNSLYFRSDMDAVWSAAIDTFRDFGFSITAMIKPKDSNFILIYAEKKYDLQSRTKVQMNIRSAAAFIEVSVTGEDEIFVVSSRYDEKRKITVSDNGWQTVGYISGLGNAVVNSIMNSMASKLGETPLEKEDALGKRQKTGGE
ncbi:MAG: hypothetical protein WA162_00215 [Thermodesulfobacteriota bacterium]